MSVEAGSSMGTGVACSAAVGVEGGVAGIGHGLDQSIGPTMPLGAPSVDVGGLHSPGLNNDVFSQTEPISEIRSDNLGITKDLNFSHIDSFDKVSPKDMLKETSILWQAPSLNINSKEESNVFAETVELESPAVESFDKISPDDIFADSISLWQAPEKTDTDLLQETSENIDIQEVTVVAESIIGTEQEHLKESISQNVQASEILEAYLTEELSSANLQTEVSEISQVKSLEMQELEADVRQAVELERALIAALEISPQEAKEKAIKTLIEVEEEKGITEKLKKEKRQDSPPDEPKYEHDQKADGKRAEYIVNAIQQVAGEVNNGKEEKISGKAVAERMPDENDGIRSQILRELKKPIKDESYGELLNELGKIKEMSSEDMEKDVSELVRNNHAIKRGSAQQRARRDEVKKVLKDQALFS